MDYKNYAYLTKPQLECVLLQMLNDSQPISLYLPRASQELQQEYVILNKLCNKIPHVDTYQLRAYMIGEFKKRLDAFTTMGNNEIYGTLEDLLKQ